MYANRLDRRGRHRQSAKHNKTSDVRSGKANGLSLSSSHQFLTMVSTRASFATSQTRLLRRQSLAEINHPRGEIMAQLVATGNDLPQGRPKLFFLMHIEVWLSKLTEAIRAIDKLTE
jgi:hypothetical protein